MESFDPDIHEFSFSETQTLIGSLIPLELCRYYRLIPFALNTESDPPYIRVAMVNPDNLEAEDALNRYLRPYGMRLHTIVISLATYEEMIAPFLADEANRREKLDGKAVAKSSISEDLEEDVPNLESALSEEDTPPLVTLVNKILAKALTDGASDIHIEPQDTFLKIRFRKDGVLQEPFPRIPKQAAPAIISRFKIIAELDITERQYPQKGRCRRKFQGRIVDFWVSSIPSCWGEDIVVRIQETSLTQLGLDHLISSPVTLNWLRDMLSRPFGLILVVGPPGSGTATTLYSMLTEINQPGIKVCTLEDQIAYALPGVTQVQMFQGKGLDYPDMLRLFHHQDPDVIMVDQIRDLDTAKTAFEAALAGHLVLTSMRSNDTTTAISRLFQMGVEPDLIAGALLGVVAQRLVRRVCSKCRIPYQPTREMLARFGFTASQAYTPTLYKANVQTPQEIQVANAAHQLCSNCHGYGYEGRCGVYEVLRLSESLETQISQQAPAKCIKEAALAEGMVTLLTDSLNLVCEGQTTLDEVERVTFSDPTLEAELIAKRKILLECRVCKAEIKREWFECLYCGTPRSLN